MEEAFLMVVEYRLTEAQQWAQTNFGGANLGDKRRTKRLVKLASQIALDSMASLPKLTESWADLKAAYRFFDTDAVTFQNVAEPHWKATRDCGAGRKLIIEDTTELDFGCTRQLEGVGPVGSGWGKGFLLHNAMMIDPATGEAMGLAAQDLFIRKPAPENETRAERRKRDRESQVWGRVIEAIDPPPPGAQFVHVMDRGADDFEVFCRAQRQQTDWVVRLKTLHRSVLDSQASRLLRSRASILSRSKAGLLKFAR
jgi:Transposase DNA-binding